MDLNARVEVNCERKDGQTENRMPILHLAKADVTKKKKKEKKKGKSCCPECCFINKLLRSRRQELSSKQN